MDEATFDSAQEDAVTGETRSYDEDLEFHNSTQKRMDNAEELVVVVVVVVVVVGGVDDRSHHLLLQYVCHDTSD